MYSMAREGHTIFVLNHLSHEDAQGIFAIAPSRPNRRLGSVETLLLPQGDDSIQFAEFIQNALPQFRDALLLVGIVACQICDGIHLVVEGGDGGFVEINVFGFAGDHVAPHSIPGILRQRHHGLKAGHNLVSMGDPVGFIAELANVLDAQHGGDDQQGHQSASPEQPPIKSAVHFFPTRHP